MVWENMNDRPTKFRVHEAIAEDAPRRCGKLMGKPVWKAIYKMVIFLQIYGSLLSTPGVIHQKKMKVKSERNSLKQSDWNSVGNLLKLILILSLCGVVARINIYILHMRIVGVKRRGLKEQQQ